MEKYCSGFWYMNIYEDFRDRQEVTAEYCGLVNGYLEGINLDLEVSTIHKKENKEKLLRAVRKKLADKFLVYEDDGWEEKETKHGYEYSRYVIADENGFSKTCKVTDPWTNYEEYTIELYYLQIKYYSEFN